MPQAICLIYNITGERLSRIRLIARRFKVQLRPVSPEDYGQPIGALLGRADRMAEAPAVPPFPDEMMVMAGFPGPLTHSFLNAFRQQGLAPVRLKAMLTETNSQWHSGRLHQELSEENEYFARMRKGLHEQQAEAQAEEAPEDQQG